jgi:hypothetical protein
MVESKAFDNREESPPLVPAASAPSEDLLRVEPLGAEDPLAPVPDMEQVSNNNDNDSDMDEMDRQQELMMGAGVGAGVLGLLLGGPFVGFMAGFGTAYWTRKPGAGGDIARGIGEVAIVAKDKAKELNQKHHLVQKGQETASEAWERAKELDRRHKILERAKEYALYTYETAKELNRQHRILERTANVIGRLLSYIGSKIGEAWSSTQRNEPPAEGEARPPATAPSQRRGAYSSVSTNSDLELSKEYVRVD